MEPVTLSDILKIISQKLEGVFNADEIQSLKKLIVESILDIPYHSVFLNPNDEVKPEKLKEFDRVLTDIIAGQPVQYAIGYTHFFDLKIKVNPSVLIPRPETEELVSLVVKENRTKTPTILDIGTGSGCIALALANTIPDSRVTGIDISDDALTLARENAELNGLNVSFIKSDIFNPLALNNLHFDIIVSNPPYVRESEKPLMKSNVLDHEPHLALFVPDEKPLIFYEAIVNFAFNHLNRDGQLYLEINEALGNEVSELLKSNGFNDVRILNDFRDRVRFAVAKSSN
ncbi:peptide chain release factor N(5)-glutamine methyltransferase [Tenuifilum thalassicum]|uniref:Release factor glutamine methyltransferase n=1 Tax=Tenuifilum thalassicum TaxID=2590900 RepID=A0A7D4CRW5_9BACT|nr:peptide chain release factor N(5)-glutamine methyltransferase [Tenuifilum thalassicum]QKG80345.1 peptide chain release factor N(5)-glutamine methyltransferase [Tenuifilum thalassicum]